VRPPGDRMPENCARPQQRGQVSAHRGRVGDQYLGPTSGPERICSSEIFRRSGAAARDHLPVAPVGLGRRHRGASTRRSKPTTTCTSSCTASAISSMRPRNANRTSSKPLPRAKHHRSRQLRHLHRQRLDDGFHLGRQVENRRHSPPDTRPWRRWRFCFCVYLGSGGGIGAGRRAGRKYSGDTFMPTPPAVVCDIVIARRRFPFRRGEIRATDLDSYRPRAGRDPQAPVESIGYAAIDPCAHVGPLRANPDRRPCNAAMQRCATGVSTMQREVGVVCQRNPAEGAVTAGDHNADLLRHCADFRI